jgi:NitT/TauT family transport system substrate-binding protein
MGDIDLRKFIAIFLLFCLAGCHRSRSGEAREVRVALSRDGITWLPVRLANTLGYFEEKNLKVSTSDVSGLSKATEALLGGSVDIAAGGLSQAIQAAAEGRNVRAFELLYMRPVMAIAVAPSMTGKIKTIADLKKHAIGVASLGSPMQQELNYELATHGLSPEDVSVVSIGTGGSSLAAIEHNQVAAAVLVGSAITTFERRNPGAVFLVDSRTPEGARTMFGSEIFPNTALIAQDSWLKANPDTARAFASAVLKAMSWMRTHTAEEVRAKMSESERLPDVEADLQAIRQAQRSLSPDGVIPDSGPELVWRYIAISSERVRDANIDLRKVYTNEFVTVR